MPVFKGYQACSQQETMLLQAPNMTDSIIPRSCVCMGLLMVSAAMRSSVP